jgi:hypothetical protein
VRTFVLNFSLHFLGAHDLVYVLRSYLEDLPSPLILFSSELANKLFPWHDMYYISNSLEVQTKPSSLPADEEHQAMTNRPHGRETMYGTLAKRDATRHPPLGKAMFREDPSENTKDVAKDEGGEETLPVGKLSSNPKNPHRSQSFVKRGITKHEDRVPITLEGNDGVNTSSQPTKGRDQKALVRGKKPMEAPKEPEDFAVPPNSDDTKSEKPRRSQRKMIMPSNDRTPKDEKTISSPRTSDSEKKPHERKEERRTTPRNSSVGATLAETVHKISSLREVERNEATDPCMSGMSTLTKHISLGVDDNSKLSDNTHGPFKDERQKGGEVARDKADGVESSSIPIVTVRKGKGKRRNTSEREMKRDIRVSGGELEVEKKQDSLLEKFSPSPPSSLTPEITEEEVGDEEERAVEDLVLKVSRGMRKGISGRDEAKEGGKEREVEPTMEQIRSRRNDPGRMSLLLPLQDPLSSFNHRR